MTTFGERLYASFMADSQAKGRKLDKVEFIDLADRMHAIATKERKRAAVAEGAEQVYELYPKKVAKDEALKAITAALKKHPLEYLLDKTNQFKAAVEGWPSSYRYMTDGGDRCPHPSTWFNQGRFQDDPKEWRRAGARSAPQHKPFQAAEATPSQESDMEALRESYRAGPEPEKGTLAHSLWLEGRRAAAVEHASSAFTETVLAVEDEQRLRKA